MLRLPKTSNSKQLLLGVSLSSLLLYSTYRLYHRFSTKPIPPPPKYHLTQTDAINRRSQLSNKEIEYSLCLKILPGLTYQGVISITFHAKYPLEDDIIIDYEGQSIEEIIVSGEKLPQINNSYKHLWDGQRIRLSKNKLCGGMNSVNIAFSNNYSKTGVGLHSYIDHLDKRQYIYSHSEPDHMHKVIPCFDQPDLKGKFKLFIVLPKNWVGISNEIINYTQDFKQANLITAGLSHRMIYPSDFFKGLEEDNHKIWDFNVTKPISTYLFSINAGPFSELRCEKTHKNLPMSFYCRESLYKFLKNQSDDMFEITNKSMEFYEGFFQTDFPFSKYDQVFCPEYNSGAMEHPGAVTINDTYIYRDKVGSDSLSYRAIVIAHEMCHMWFGDLVTMTWWEDLWLNESFADFFCYLCLDKVKLTNPLGDMNILFNSGKGSAYRCDQMKTTHPVSGVIRDTEEIMNYFDGITYSKGAAILKQLLFIIGEKAFSRALGVYFGKYKWENARLEDFISALNTEYEQLNNPLRLDVWKEEWLSTAGLNECVPIWDVNKNSNNEFLIIKQTACLKEFPTLRHHKMKIAFILDNGKIGKVNDIFLENKPETIISYDGSAGYKAILANYEDYSYIKLVLDIDSIEFFRNNLSKIQHSLSRSMIWRAFYDMVRDGKLSSNEYAEIFEMNIEEETDEAILDDILSYANYNFSWTPLSYRKELGHKLFKRTYDIIKNTKSESILILLNRSLIKFAYHEEDIDLLYDWLKGKEPVLKSQEISIYNGWDIIKAIYRSSKYNNQEKQELFDKQAIRDPESTKFMEKTFKALIATEEERKKLWASYLNENNQDSVQLIEASMEGFNDDNIKRNEVYNDLYFKELVNISRKREAEFAKAFYWGLFPNSDDFVYLKRKIEEVINKTTQGDFSLRKFLEEQFDMTERRLNACERFINSYKVTG